MRRKLIIGPDGKSVLVPLDVEGNAKANNTVQEGKEKMEPEKAKVEPSVTAGRSSINLGAMTSTPTAVAEEKEAEVPAPDKMNFGAVQNKEPEREQKREPEVVETVKIAEPAKVESKPEPEAPAKAEAETVEVEAVETVKAAEPAKVPEPVHEPVKEEFAPVTTIGELHLNAKATETAKKRVAPVMSTVLLEYQKRGCQPAKLSSGNVVINVRYIKDSVVAVFAVDGEVVAFSKGKSGILRDVTSMLSIDNDFIRLNNSIIATTQSVKDVK